jgi:hypothetical protein
MIDLPCAHELRSLTTACERDPRIFPGGKLRDKSWATFLQRNIRMILLAFLDALFVQKIICSRPLPTYNE